MGKKPRYEIAECTDSAMIIKDIGPWDQHLTVTNGIEMVVEELHLLLGNRRLFCIDSSGNRDRVLIENGRFAGWYYA